MAKERCYTLDWKNNRAGVAGVFVREIYGGSGGPTLLVTAGEHGAELSGCGAIDSLCRHLAGVDFRGALLAIPCLSPCNIRHRSHVYDQTYGEKFDALKDYNTYQAWPGRPDGSPAERLCHVVWNEVVSRADAVINFHSWQNSAGCLFTDGTVPGAMELAKCYGSVFNILRYDIKKGLHYEVLRTGRPAALVETHGQYRIEPEAAACARQGMLNTMIHMGMIDGEILLPGAMFSVEGEHLIHAPKAGLFVPLMSLEQTVRRGDMLGYILDVETGARTDVVSPADGAIWLIARNGPRADLVMQGLQAYADPGDLVALIKEVRPI